jgi:hypothetical protein
MLLITAYEQLTHNPCFSGDEMLSKDLDRTNRLAPANCPRQEVEITGCANQLERLAA